MKINVKAWNDAVMKALNIDDVKRVSSNYMNQVNKNKQTPFFNKNNTVQDWAFKKVPQQFKERGFWEGMHGVTNPITMNPYIHPIEQPLVSEARMRASYLPNNKVGSTVKGMLGLPNRVNRLPRKNLPFGGYDAFWNQK